MINYGKQFIDKSDINSVSKILKSDYITQGKTIFKFEKRLSQLYGSKYCSVLSSGTAALHLLGKALGWKKNDIVITTPISFLATSNCILYSGARPVFVDIDQATNTISLEKLKKKILSLIKERKKIVAIICTDYAGFPCDWKQLRKISKEFQIKLINDNCHAMGASIDGDKKYALKYADYATLSFHAVKHITTGEGGAVISNDAKIINKINILKTHGVIKKKPDMPWIYEMIDLGYNYRITDFQCALGLSQLKKIKKFNSLRKKIVNIYDKYLSGYKNVVLPIKKKNFESANHLYPLRINFKKIGINKKLLFKKMKQCKINLQVHYIPIHLQKYYRENFHYKKGDFPNAENFYEQEVSLPVYYGLKEKQVMYIISKLIKILKLVRK